MFPEELPRRLIRMFSFPEETVLDPFLGSGTTLKVAVELGRDGIGYEIQPAFVPIIKQKMGLLSVTIIQREQTYPPGYFPRIKDARPLVDPKLLKFGDTLYRVTAIRDDLTLQMDNGLVVSLQKIRIPGDRMEQDRDYLIQWVNECSYASIIPLKLPMPQFRHTSI